MDSLGSRYTRRGLLQRSLEVAMLAMTPLSTASRLLASPKFGTNPFKLGVASGEPAPDSFVIWTRLALILWHPIISGHGISPCAGRWLKTSICRLRFAAACQLPDRSALMPSMWKFKDSDQTDRTGTGSLQAPRKVPSGCHARRPQLRHRSPSFVSHSAPAPSTKTPSITLIDSWQTTGLISSSTWATTSTSARTAIR